MPHALAIYGDDELLLELPLTDDQYDSLKKLIPPDSDDPTGAGCYELAYHVFLEPRD
jgi:hypothetical protein